MRFRLDNEDEILDLGAAGNERLPVSRKELEFHVERSRRREVADDDNIDVFETVAVELQAHEYLDVVFRALADVGPYRQNLPAQMLGGLELLAFLDAKQLDHLVLSTAGNLVTEHRSFAARSAWPTAGCRGRSVHSQRSRECSRHHRGSSQY